MDEVRYGLIGTGMMGHEHIRNLALLDGVRVAAVSDPDDAMRASAASLAGPGCAAFRDHRELLDAGCCDALIIASPNHTHYAILGDALDSDLPLLVEKPLCTTVEHCRAVAARAAARAAPVWVAMEYRYMPPLARLIEGVHEGLAGAPRMLTIREHRFPFLRKVGDWNRFNANTGGTLVEKCCHHFDLMRLILRSEPIRVYASGAMDVNFVDESYGGRRPDVLDNAFVIVDFASGARALLDLCMFADGAYWQEEISVTGARARIDVKIPGPARFSPDGAERDARLSVSPRDSKIERRIPVAVDRTVLAAGDHHGSTYYQHVKFLELVRHGGIPEVDVDAGLRAVAIGAAAEASARSGAAVTPD